MFTASEMERLEVCLARLVPHLDTDDVALTGGVAVELHLAAARRPGRRDVIGDLDFVARRMDAVAPSVTREFLVSHYHTPQTGVPKAIVQLVDPRTRLKIDIFPDLTGSLSRASRTAVGGAALLVLDARSILEHKLQTMRNASESNPVDAKHWLDAAALAELCELAPPPPPANAAPDVHRIDVGFVCARCELSRAPEFPLAPKGEIFALLGYV